MGEPVETKPLGPALSRNTFWGGVLSVTLGIAGSGYSYISGLKSDIEAQGRDIAVLKSQLDDMRQLTKSLDAKLDRLLIR